MKLISAVSNIKSFLSKGLKRFTVTIFMSTAVAIMLIIISELQPINSQSLRDNLNRITMIFAIGIPLSLCLKVFYEREERENRGKLIIYYLAGAALLLLYYFLLLNNLNFVSITRYVGLSFALYLTFLVIPYVPRKEQFEMYIIKVLIGFFTTAIYAIVLFLGLSAILFTVDRLLGVNIKEQMYYYTWLVVVFIFAPAYFLAGIPKKNQLIETEGYPKLLRILLLYIVMPLLSVYTTILYIYFAKIIITRQWPVGLVSHLVLWYSVIVAIVLFFITPIKDEISWSNKFFLWLPRVIIPILITMFVSMGIRIKAYGITENRYYVIVLGLWVSAVMIYFILSKKFRNIFIPVTLSLIAIISVLGPLSSYSISKFSQNNRLKKILVENAMLKDGKLEKAPSTISKEHKVEISSILQYFRNSHSLEEARYVPENFRIEDMDKVFGFTYESPRPGGGEDYFYFTRSNSNMAISIKDYDYLLDARSFYDKSLDNSSDIGIIYDYESSIVKISYKGEVVSESDLTIFTNNLIEKYGANAKENILSREEMTLIEENNKVKVKYIFTHISGSKNPSTGNIQGKDFEFYMLVKFK